MSPASIFVLPRKYQVFYYVTNLMLVTTVPATDANRALYGFANGSRLRPSSISDGAVFKAIAKNPKLLSQRLTIIF
jgi:hypothetical protein